VPSPRAFEPIGRYVEDWQAGDEMISPGRTYTSADLAWFARWMGAETATVMDESHLVMAAMFLIQRLGIVEGTGVSNLGSKWTFLRRVHEGDTLWVRIRCVTSRPSQSLPDNGVARFDISIENQRDEVVATVDWSTLILRRDANGFDGPAPDVRAS
jgi:acyl dehydratase